MLAVLTLLFLTVRYKVRKWTAGGEPLSPDLKVFDHPFAAAATAVLLVATSPYWAPLPATTREIFQALSLLPIIILVRQVVSARLVPGLYALGLLFVMDAAREVFGGVRLMGQVFLI
jgi:hypothetical protein